MKISSFSGEYRFLSNFWPSEIQWENKIWPTVEHAYQASKTLDEHEKNLVHSASTAAKAKQSGKIITMRPDWDGMKFSVMVKLIHLKFQIPELRKMLNSTGNAELIEGNTWGDTYWGICNGIGQNNLGKILMAERDSFW
jgi:ribA/ribD-fused uncharacterized protein